MNIEEMIIEIEDEMDGENLKRVMDALRKGWARAYPGEGLNIIALPRRKPSIERWFFGRIHALITEYLKMDNLQQ